MRVFLLRGPAGKQKMDKKCVHVCVYIYIQIDPYAVQTLSQVGPNSDNNNNVCRAPGYYGLQ